MNRHQGIRARIVEYLQDNGPKNVKQIREALNMDGHYLWINLLAACHEGVVKKTKTEGLNLYDVGIPKSRYIRTSKKHDGDNKNKESSAITPPSYKMQQVRQQLGMA